MQHDVLLITLWFCCILDRPIRRTVQDSERTTAINVKEKKSILRTVKRVCISHNKPFTINTPNLLPTVWCTSALVATSLLKKHCICSLIWNSGGLTKQMLTWREKYWHGGKFRRPHKANTHGMHLGMHLLPIAYSRVVMTTSWRHQTKSMSEISFPGPRSFWSAPGTCPASP